MSLGNIKKSTVIFKSTARWRIRVLTGKYFISNAQPKYLFKPGKKPNFHWLSIRCRIQSAQYSLSFFKNSSSITAFWLLIHSWDRGRETNLKVCLLLLPFCSWQSPQRKGRQVCFLSCFQPHTSRSWWQRMKGAFSLLTRMYDNSSLNLSPWLAVLMLLFWHLPLFLQFTVMKVMH